MSKKYKKYDSIIPSYTLVSRPQKIDQHIEKTSFFIRKKNRYVHRTNKNNIIPDGNISHTSENETQSKDPNCKHHDYNTCMNNEINCHETKHDNILHTHIEKKSHNENYDIHQDNNMEHDHKIEQIENVHNKIDDQNQDNGENHINHTNKNMICTHNDYINEHDKTLCYFHNDVKDDNLQNENTRDSHCDDTIIENTHHDNDHDGTCSYETFAEMLLACTTVKSEDIISHTTSSDKMTHCLGLMFVIDERPLYSTDAMEDILIFVNIPYHIGNIIECKCTMKSTNEYSTKWRGEMDKFSVSNINDNTHKIKLQFKNVHINLYDNIRVDLTFYTDVI